MIIYIHFSSVRRAHASGCFEQSCIPKRSPPLIALTRGVARFSHHIKLNTSFRKDIAMWQIFLDHWNGSNFFLESKTTQSPGPTFLYRRIREPGVWRFLQQPMVPRPVAARVPFSYGATKHCLERTLPNLSCLHGLGPPMVRQANTPLVR